MTPEEIRIAVAEECGIIAYDDCPGYGFRKKGGRACNVPNYPFDLNAMREARQSFTQAEKVKYLNVLREVLHKKYNRAISDYDLLDAEATDQAEAFLRVNGKWRE